MAVAKDITAALCLKPVLFTAVTRPARVEVPLFLTEIDREQRPRASKKHGNRVGR